jgi:hypothetical protein
MSKNLTVVEYVINRLADLGIDRASYISQRP